MTPVRAALRAGGGSRTCSTSAMGWRRLRTCVSSPSTRSGTRCCTGRPAMPRSAVRHGVRFLAPEPLRRSVPGAVRRVAEHDARSTNTDGQLSFRRMLGLPGATECARPRRERLDALRDPKAIMPRRRRPRWNIGKRHCRNRIAIASLSRDHCGCAPNEVPIRLALLWSRSLMHARFVRSGRAGRGPTASVSQTAGSTCRFAAQYRALFGEAPSTTLGRRLHSAT